jgi:hypothetical protein
VPGFKEAYLKYLSEVEDLSYAFIELVAEALGLSPDGLARFYDSRERMQHRSKVRAFFFLNSIWCVWSGEGRRLSISTRRVIYDQDLVYH